MLRMCACCGMPYEAKNKDEKWCISCRCAHPKPPIRQKTQECPVCGDWFVPTNTKMIYCTGTCKQSEHGKRLMQQLKDNRKREREAKRAKEAEMKKIRTEWWQKYMKSDRLGQDTMLARRFGYSSYGTMMAAIEQRKTTRTLLELTAMQQEREKYEKERESNGETV